MKARLVPVYFPEGRDEEFDRQLLTLQALLAEEAEFLDPVPLGADLPNAEAALFPQLLGQGYREASAFRTLGLPVLIITSEFGTMSMWDWELSTYLKEHGVVALAPYTLDQSRMICRSLGVKRELKETRFLVFQDNPGAGQQASIFKRFYWWEDECSQRMLDKFGVEIVHKSFRELGEKAKNIPDEALDAARSSRSVPVENVGPRALDSALRMYVALKQELDADPSIRAAGMNCLNESHFSDTTPCLAWNLLFEERRLIWGCEGDTVSMLTKYMLHKCLNAPIMMTNMYPFLMGQAALKHERIPAFPERDDPANYVLVAHCGYFGIVPQSFASEWTLRPKVLRIVDDNATALDARLPTGPVTLAKLSPSFDKLIVGEGELEGYAQYPGSDCLNGGVIRVRDGHSLMTKLPSHHALLMTGHHQAGLEHIGSVFGLAIERI